MFFDSERALRTFPVVLGNTWCAAAMLHSAQRSPSDFHHPPNALMKITAVFTMSLQVLSWFRSPDAAFNSQINLHAVATLAASNLASTSLSLDYRLSNIPLLYALLTNPIIDLGLMSELVTSGTFGAISLLLGEGISQHAIWKADPIQRSETTSLADMAFFICARIVANICETNRGRQIGTECISTDFFLILKHWAPYSTLDKAKGGEYCYYTLPKNSHSSSSHSDYSSGFSLVRTNQDSLRPSLHKRSQAG